MKKCFIFATIALAFVMSWCDARAAFFNIPVPNNAFVHHNGADWAWAYPLPAPQNDFDLSYQSTQGWRIPTAAELNLAPLATTFLFAGGNVPLGGMDPATGAVFDFPNGALTSDGAVAVPYFSNLYRHADWQDGLGQTFGPWAGMPGAENFADQLVIRGQVVPEPAALLLVLCGLAGAGNCRRRRAH